jgi:hypothetical protein
MASGIRSTPKVLVLHRDWWRGRRPSAGLDAVFRVGGSPDGPRQRENVTVGDFSPSAGHVAFTSTVHPSPPSVGYITENTPTALLPVCLRAGQREACLRLCGPDQGFAFKGLRSRRATQSESTIVARVIAGKCESDLGLWNCRLMFQNAGSITESSSLPDSGPRENLAWPDHGPGVRRQCKTLHKKEAIWLFYRILRGRANNNCDR